MLSRLSLATLSLSTLALSACTPSMPIDEHALHDMGSSSQHTVSQGPDRLNDSPRHQEWVEVKRGDRTIYTWVVYPQVSEPRPVVLVIHENRGLNDWARSFADQVAEAGYIAVAPDLLSGFSETEQRTSDFANDDAARTAIGQLQTSEVMADLSTVATWAKSLPASNQRLASAGFCWGGSQSFQFATQSDELDLAMVFYGTGPTDASAYAKIDVPVVAFYGGSDERVNATIPLSVQAMSSAGKRFDYQVYEGAGHAFMRLGEDAAGDPANITARHTALARMKAQLETLVRE